MNRVRVSPGRTHVGLLLSLLVVTLHVLMPSSHAGGWYVGNTASSEWIEYKRVWFSAGTYRFTARAGSTAANSKIRVEIDNVVVQWSVPVPNTGRPDAFTHVHLGQRAISQGYHDIKVVFETANVSLDWFMLSKDSDATTSVKPSDITMVRPSTTGTLIAPVVGFEHKTTKPGVASSLLSVPETDGNGNAFTDTQLKTWYSVPMYRDYDRRSDRYWDVLVDELLASRAQVPLLHCRVTNDFTRGLQDRDYAEGAGAYEGRWLMKFAEAVARNPQAASALKIGMFWESGGIASEFNNRYGYYPSWGDPALLDYVMQYWINPWFDNVPASLLYQPIANRPIISFFASRPDNIVNDGRMGDFLIGVRSRLQERYGLSPLFILPVGGDVNSAALNEGWGQAPWVTWDGALLETVSFGGGTWGTTMVGSRRRLDTVWMNDWNPVTNTGTPNPADANGIDSHQSRRNGSGDSVLWGSLNTARSTGIKLVQQEGFTNISEGNAIFRSYHPEFSFPNQHIAVMREFSDPDTQTLIFEAEGCDNYSKSVNDGNSGGSFRYDWYNTCNLDVYRPLSNLQNWISKSTGPGNLTQISAGFYDVWAVASDGKVWAQPLMGGTNAWQQVSAPTMTSVSVGKGYAWGLNGTTVYSTTIPYQWPHWTNTGWTTRTGTMVQIDVGDTEVWGVNSSGQVFRRPLDGSGSWTMVTGTMDRISVGDAFIWGIQGTNISYSRTSTVSWNSVANPNNITKIEVGSEEVWGTTAAGQLYRRSASGVGDWEAVTNPGSAVTSLSVGDGYAWALTGATPYMRRLEGFRDAPSAPPAGLRAIAGNAQVNLTWTASTGATGYNVKRSTTPGGSYTTIASNILPFTTSLSYTDGTASNGTTYYYVVSAITPSAETANSSEATATPQSATPTAPSSLSASSGFGSSIALTWVDNSTTEAGFKIERKTGSGGTYVQLAVVPKNTTTYSDSVVSGFDYYYRVRAYNPAGNSSYSNEASFSTSANKLSRTGWTATASVSAGFAPPSNVLDGNSTTRWGAGVGQAPGQWFQVDMGSLKTVYQLSLEMSGGDYPRGYQVHVSTDGTNWGSPVASGVGTTVATVIPFTPKVARYVRVTQTGTDGVWWSIEEFNVYGAAAQVLSRSGWNLSASSSASGNAPTNATDGNAGTRWSTGANQAPGQWFQIDLGSLKEFHQVVLDTSGSSGDYPRGYSVTVSVDGVNWSAPVIAGTNAAAITTLSFPSQTARYIRITQTGSNAGWWSIHEVNVYGAVLSAPGTPSSFTATGGNTQVTLGWNAVSGATGYNVKRGTVSGGPYTTVGSYVSGTSFINTGLTNGTTYYYVVSAVNGGGESANSTQATATPGALPSPWQTLDIGSVGIAGNASFISPTYTLIGSGADIWGTADAFRYVHQASSGDCSVVARVATVQNTNTSAKAGVMIRESTAAGAIHAAVFVTPGSGLIFQWRTSTGGTCTSSTASGTAPRWVRITRTGNSFTAHYSSNGTSWTQIGSAQTISMSSSARIGLAVTARNNAASCTATLDSVTATP